MRNWPTWIPNLNAWMSAILLILLVRGIAVVIKIMAQYGYSLLEISPKLRIFFYFLALLSPILVIAVAHHLLHQFLEWYAPSHQSRGMGRAEGVFPTLMSWWEGFYGWMAIALAIVVSFMIEILSSRSYNSLYELLAWWDELKDLFTLPTLYRVVIAAYLYQFEYLVRNHLMAVGSASESD